MTSAAFYPTLFQHLATDYQRNLAVTAGAGTGKTEVLTRRIIKILARESHLLDRLLVLTFTDKAAVEMKERIYKAIESEREKTGNPHFQKLKDTFLNNYISTIHSFCAALLREYPIEAGIDPYFRVLDETEKVFFLRKTITRAVREQAAEKNNRDIRLLSEEFSRAAIANAVFTIIQKREDTVTWIDEYKNLEWTDYRKRLKSYRACIIREICYKLYISGHLQEQLASLQELNISIPDGDYAINRKFDVISEILPALINELKKAGDEPVYELKDGAESIDAAENDSAAKICIGDSVGDGDSVGNGVGEVDCNNNVNNKLNGNDKSNDTGDCTGGCTNDGLNFDVKQITNLCAKLLIETKSTGRAPNVWPEEVFSKVRGIFRSLRYIIDAFPIAGFEISEEHEKLGFETLKALASLTSYALKSYHDDKSAENYLDFQDLQLKVLNLLSDNKNRHILDEIREKFKFLMIDEFQDTNDIQWRIIKKIAADNSEKIVNPRLFVVGDEKQAIYSFRGGDVRLFSRVRKELLEANRQNLLNRHPFELLLEDEKDYTSEYQERLKDDMLARDGEIVFSDNFRSAEVPVNFFNMFFHDLLSRKLYEEYDARPQILHCSGNKTAGSVELLLVDKDDAEYDEVAAFREPALNRGKDNMSSEAAKQNGSGRSDDEAAFAGPAAKPVLGLKPHLKEALLIAGKIREVFSGDDEKYRRVRENAAAGKPAIAILLNRRTMLKTYEEALRMNRINFTVVRGRGFFQRQEIVDIGNLLHFITEPSNDLFLTAFLRSPAGHVSDEGIFLLTKTIPGITLWEKLCGLKKELAVAGVSASDDSSTGVSAPVALFNDRDLRAILNAAANLEKWLDLSGRLSLTEFLRLLLKEGGYYVSLSRGLRGRQAISNIEKLLDSARDLSLLENGDLADFAQWLDNRINFIDEEGEADIDISLGGAVQIMTVHQSKGLEFPMVFVPDLRAGFNLGEREALYAEQVPFVMNISADTITRREHPEIGISAPDPENGWESEPLLIKRIIKKRLRDKLIAEKKRLFYVAATRAMDHLVLVGNADFSSERLIDRICYMPLDLMTNWLEWLNKILGITFNAKGLKGEIRYANQAGTPMTIPYQKYITTDLTGENETEYRTIFPLMGQ